MKLKMETVLFTDDNNIIKVGDIVSINKYNKGGLKGKIINIYETRYDFTKYISLDMSTEFDSNVIDIKVESINTIEKINY